MLTASKVAGGTAVRAEVFREYCAGSSIHGVRYFDRVERTSCERFWWIAVFLLSMGGCGTMIFKAYTKWNQAPIIVTFSEKSTPVWEILFPAITICPETKIDAQKLNFTAEMKAINEEYFGSNDTFNASTITQVKVVAQLCNYVFQSRYNYRLSYLNGTDESTIVEMLKKMSLDRHQVIALCAFDGAHRSCDDFMTEIITEEGLCYSFNMMSEDTIFRKNALQNEHTYMEEWYSSETNNDTTSRVPLRARGAGLHAGLMLYLFMDKLDIDYICTGFSQGYKIMLHESNEYPQVSKRNIRIPLGHEISIAVKPQMITTSQSAADYPWQKRQCFFNHERHLRFFQVYNQENCELECLTNITLTVCGCVRFSMPRSEGMDVCPLDKWVCMQDARSFFGLHQNFSYLGPSFREGDKIASQCNCLPACSSIQYDVEVTQSAMDLKKFLEANQLINEDSYRYTCSILEIYFKESHFITSKRSELYGLVDFLANCGGLLGLFMGVSILSLLEICYYIAIRPFSLRKQRRRLGFGKRRPYNEANNSLLAVVSKVD